SATMVEKAALIRSVAFQAGNDEIVTKAVDAVFTNKASLRQPEKGFLNPQHAVKELRDNGLTLLEADKETKFVILHASEFERRKKEANANNFVEVVLPTSGRGKPRRAITRDKDNPTTRTQISAFLQDLG